MATIPGSIPLTGPIAPTDTADSYPVLDVKYAKGGYQTVESLEEMAAITSARRTPGMRVYVAATQKDYRLGSDLETWTEIPNATGFLPLTGGTMSGQILLPDPSAPQSAATKGYVDTGLATKLNRSGGTMTGALVLAADPSAPLQAATKQYVDANNPSNRVLRAGDTMTGLLTLLGGIASDPGVSQVQFRLAPTTGTRDIASMLEGEVRMVDGGLQVRARLRTSTFSEVQPLVKVFGGSLNNSTNTLMEALHETFLTYGGTTGIGLVLVDKVSQTSARAGTVNGVGRRFINDDHAGSSFSFEGATVEGTPAAFQIFSDKVRIIRGRHLAVQSPSGANRCMGSVDLVAGVATVTTTKALVAGCLVFVAGNSEGSGPSTWGSLVGYSNGVNAIVIKSSNTADTRRVNWWIIEHTISA